MCPECYRNVCHPNCPNGPNQPTAQDFAEIYLAEVSAFEDAPSMGYNTIQQRITKEAAEFGYSWEEIESALQCE